MRTARSILGVLCLSLAGVAGVRLAAGGSSVGGPSGFVLLGGRSLHGRQIAVTGGDVGVNRPGGDLFVRSSLDAPDASVVASRVRIGADSRCRRVLTDADRSGAPLCHASPGGAFTSPVGDLASACGFPAPFPACDGATPVTVRRGEHRTLPAGVFGDVHVTGGGQAPGVLELAGDYVFCGLRLGRGARLVAPAGASIAVAERVAIGNETIVGGRIGAEAVVAAGAVRIVTAGRDVLIGRATQIDADVCAPHSRLAIGDASRLRGSFVADVIRTARVSAEGRPGSPNTCPEGFLVTVSLDFSGVSSLAGIKLDLGYPSSLVIPGTGGDPSVVDRVTLLQDGTSSVNDHDTNADQVDDTLTNVIVNLDAGLHPGDVETVRFDCLALARGASDLRCQVSDPTDANGFPVQQPIGCTVRTGSETTTTTTSSTTTTATTSSTTTTTATTSTTTVTTSTTTSSTTMTPTTSTTSTSTTSASTTTTTRPTTSTTTTITTTTTRPTTSTTTTTSTSTTTTISTTTSTQPATTTTTTTTATTTTPTSSTTTTTVRPVCGNGTVEPPETCDDRNKKDENDATVGTNPPDFCPASCRIETCAAQSGSAFGTTVNFTVPSGKTVAGVTVFVDYPEGKVVIPGSGSASTVGQAITNKPSNALSSPNDLDYGLIEGLLRATAIPSGRLFTLTYQTCQGSTAPVAADFRCTVKDATDLNGNVVTGVTCAVALP